jgi:hypothetical protein
MFAALKNLIPEPRQADGQHPYEGRHRVPDTDAEPDGEPESRTAFETAPMPAAVAAARG